MREIILDARELAGRERAHKYLKERLGFPDFYGGNLDALHDMLGELTDTRIIFQNPSALNDEYAHRVLSVFLSSASENPRITVILKP